MKLNKLMLPAVIVLFIFSLSFSQNTDSFRTASFNYTEQGQAITWIYFKDKGPQELLKTQSAEELLTERALKRRRKVMPEESLTDFSDMRIYHRYLELMKPYISKIRARSRWLNAISVETGFEQLEQINQLEFVKKIVPVRATKKRKPLIEQNIQTQSNDMNLKKASALDYGESIHQVSLINADVLHEKGLHGQGVLICLLDDGFNLLNYHIAFDSLDVEATWDFIHDDEDVTDSEFKASQGWHGTKTLSTIAGYTPGKLIGTAFKASFLLGKTEVDATETQIEEDYWVEGIEWADSLGADVVSSSLGYIDWYTWQDMNGETAVTTIAADLAVEKGIIVFNSAGNEYDNADHNTLIAPADGDYVLAVASTNASGVRAGSSSVGPSADGRIKPDIAAMGQDIVCASATTDTVFLSVGQNGTSFSCPIAAGASALLLQAFPELTPAQLQHALRTTASQSDAPDKYLGWGVIDVAAAFEYIDTSGLERNPLVLVPENLEVYQNFPNPFNPETTFRYRIKKAGMVVINIFNINGELVKTFNPIYRSANFYKKRINMRNYASGVYYYRVSTTEMGSGQTYYKFGKMVFVK